MSTAFPARWWHRLEDGRVQCDLCPRDCKLNDGQRGFCFVRQRVGEGLVLDTYGRSSGFCVDPVEKKPLNHFYPGSSVLSFGTAGCNLGCRFCQNWDIQVTRLSEWMVEHLGPDVPLHFTAFHPDFKMLDVPPTPPATLTRARGIARRAGLRHVYTGNAHDTEGDTTLCGGCGTALIVRDWYRLLSYRVTPEGACPGCGAGVPGRFDAAPGAFGARRVPVRLASRKQA